MKTKWKDTPLAHKSIIVFSVIVSLGCAVLVFACAIAVFFIK